MKKIFTVECEIPGGFGEYIGFDSRTTLLDADLTLFNPSSGDLYGPDFETEYYEGKPLLSEASSFQYRNAIAHWRRELTDTLNAGRNVFMILSDIQELYGRTGQKKRSGTGQDRRITNFVSPLCNYGLLPFQMRVIESKGDSMTLHSGGQVLNHYWQKFGSVSSYRVRFEESRLIRPLVTTRHGGWVVGAIVETKSGGTLVMLPWVDFCRQEFLVRVEEDKNNEVESEEEQESDFGHFEAREKWTPNALEWGKEFLRTLESMDQAIRIERETTPIPPWVRNDSFRSNQEISMSERLLQIQSRMDELEWERETVEAELANAEYLKGLLYEQGRMLEKAVLEAMRLIGFDAKHYRDSDSEFDLVFECVEGRYIGEVEGRDNKAIGINKMRQLEVNILEDLSRDEVSEPAKGILFGNAYRLIHPSERPKESYTAKCLKAAKRNGNILIRTCDLFYVAKALSNQPDPEFAASCRKTIFDTVGKEVRFPILQKSGTDPEVQ